MPERTEYTLEKDGELWRIGLDCVVEAWHDMASGAHIVDRVVVVGNTMPDGWAHLTGEPFFGRRAVRNLAPATTSREGEWVRLRCELQTLQEKGCRSVDPVVILRFMDYINEVAEAK